MRPDGLPKPSQRRCPTKTKPREEPIVVRDSPPIRSCVYDDQRWQNRGWPPTLGLGNVRSDASLHVEVAEDVLDVDDQGLDLNGQQHPRIRVICQQVDATAVAVTVEAGLRYDEPAMVRQQAGNRLGDVRVVGVPQASQLWTAMASVPSETKLHCFRDSSHCADGHAGCLAPLKEPNDACANPSPHTEIDLAPAAPMAEDTDGSPELDVVHVARLDGAPLSTTYRGLTE